MEFQLDEIVDVNKIGTVPEKTLQEILDLAKQEKLKPASSDEKKVLLLGIDLQNDFMDHGALGVPGAHEDVKNLLNFIYKNMEKITDIYVSLDTHKPMQIFHPAWWVNQEGHHPQPYTIVSAEAVRAGKWQAVHYEQESLDYVEKLEKIGKKQLCIWPYHCIQGTFGHALEGQFSNLIHYHAIARKTEVQMITKGLLPLTEMYGIFRPEYSRDDYRDIALLEKVASFDQIFIAGEAKSHCVLESLIQMLEYFNEKGISGSKIYLLEDCMSSITGFEEDTENAIANLQDEYGIHLVKSTEVNID